MAEDFDLQDLALVWAMEDSAGGRQARMVLGGGFDSSGRGKQTEVPGFGKRQAQVGVVGKFLGALAGAFGEVAFREGLQAPGDAFDEPALVAGAGGFAEEGAIAGA